MRELLLVLRRLAGAALALILMGPCAPAFAIGADNPAVATPNRDFAAMPAGSCADMAACVERLPFAAHACEAPRPAMHLAAPDSSTMGRERGVVQMPPARLTLELRCKFPTFH